MSEAMAKGITTAGQTTAHNHPQTSLFSIARRTFSVIIGSSLMGFGLSPFLTLEAMAAFSLDLPNERHSSLNPSIDPRFRIVSSSQSVYQSPTQPTGLEHQTITQLPDSLWDLIPPDVLPPGIIPDGDFVAFLQETGELLQTVSDRRGQYALITASALANDNPRLVVLDVPTSRLPDWHHDLQWGGVRRLYRTAHLQR